MTNIWNGFAALPMPKVQNFCGGVQVSVQRTTFMKMMNAGKDITCGDTSLSQVASQVNVAGIGEEGGQKGGQKGSQKGGQKGGQKEEERTIDTILRLIKANPYITRNALVETVGISSSAIQKHINRLKVDHTIIRHGGDRGGYWEIIGTDHSD